MSAEAAPLPAAGTAPDAPRPALALSLAAVASILLCLVPFARVIHMGPWLWASTGVILAIVATGYVLRLVRIGWYLAPLVQLVLATLLLTAVFFPQDAFLGFLPTSRIVGALPDIAAGVRTEILMGFAPIEASAGLALFIAAATAVLTIFADHTTTSARLPLLTATMLAVVALIPALAVPTEFDAGAVLCAILIVLVQLRVGSWDRRGRRAAGGSFVVTSFITVCAIAITGVVTPILPLSGVARSTFGTGTSVRPTLDLGRDLREQSSREVMRVASDHAAPYTRIATLSNFTGTEWLPDSGQTARISGAETLPFDDPLAEGVRVEKVRSHIEIKDLTSSWLPLPYRARSVERLQGNWWFLPDNGTASSTDSSANDESYVIESDLVVPTREQAQASVSSGVLSGQLVEVPRSVRERAGSIAARVTEDASNDYDRLVALQSWFRTEFEYSLDAPVTGDYDGSSAPAILGFLDAQSGYCVHFASTFAVMARTLGMPSRVVVGFLPGTPTRERWDDIPVTSVAARQLHSWPEVYFAGLGWIPFEPTPGLGRETVLASESGAEDPEPSASPRPTASASASPTTSPTAAAPEAQNPDTEAGVGGDASALFAVLATALLVLLLLATPLLWRALRRRRRLRAADHGSARAAWRELQDTLIDHGERLRASETARQLAGRLSRDGIEVAALAAALERVEYGVPGEETDRSLRGELTAAIRAVSVRSRRATRTLATLAPRSLLFRPPSARRRPRAAESQSGSDVG